MIFILFFGEKKKLFIGKLSFVIILNDWLSVSFVLFFLINDF